MTFDREILLRGAVVHEVGHAMAAEAFGWDVTSVTVDGHGGGTTLIGWPVENTPAGRWRSMTVKVAGAAAELLVAGRAGDCESFFEYSLELVEEETRAPGRLDDEWAAEEQDGSGSVGRARRCAAPVRIARRSARRR